VVPSNSSLSTVTLYSSVITTLVYNDTKRLVPWMTLTVIMKFSSTVPANVCKEQSKFELTRGQQIFKKYMSHFQILGAQIVTQNMFLTDYPKFWSDLRT